MSSYLRRLSLRFLLDKLLHHNGENGPGGIRTRICDLDRVLCSPYTTGPERAWSAQLGSARLQITIWVSPCRIGTSDAASEKSTAPPCRTERDKDGPPAEHELFYAMRNSYQPRVCSMWASSSPATARPFMAPTRSSLTSSNTLGSL
jgi:hypothetical protein